ncbi:MAG: hypothetical protein IKU03_05050 [Bacteroidales bacterium]|nr:hypothetical protein [Bacteroidales bacterium]
MNPGKNRCKYLKEVRQKIADENGIPLQQRERSKGWYWISREHGKIPSHVWFSCRLAETAAT